MLFIQSKGWSPLLGALHKSSQVQSSFSGVRSLSSLCVVKDGDSREVSFPMTPVLIRYPQGQPTPVCV